MKKLFYSLSLALIGGLAVNAAPVKMSNTEKTLVNLEEVKAQSAAMKAYRVDANGNALKRNVKKNSGLPSDVTPYLGYWKWAGDNGLSGVVLPNQGVLNISQHPQYADSLLISGFDSFADRVKDKGGLTGYFKNGRVYIPNQQTLPANSGFNEGGYTTMFANKTLRNLTPAEKEEYEKENGPGSSQGLGYTIDAPKGVDFFFALDSENGVEYITSVYYEDPSAEHTNEVLMQSWSAATDQAYDIVNGQVKYVGYYWYCTHISGQKLELFEFDQNEWTYAGDAQFKDAWFAGIFTVDIPEYDVELYRSTVTPNRYLVYDPYGPNSPFGEYGINESDAEGYLIFDMVENPNIVLFEPFVYALTMDDSENYDGSDLEAYYCLNAEGDYYFNNGASLEQIENMYLDAGTDYSYFEESDNTIYIYNAVFNVIPAYGFTTTLYWSISDMSGYLKLPDNFDAVESIISDNSNAPVEYYNLQGQKVNNPSNGMYIIRQGNKTTKVMIRK